MKTATLKLTKKVPKGNIEVENFQGGGVCLYSDSDKKDTFYFGWRDKSAISYPIGEAIQRAIVLFNRYKYNEITLIIESDLTEEKKKQILTIKPI
jgi:hypothetical protein